MVSLVELSEVTEEGVRFRSPYGGEEILLSPEKSIEIQNALGESTGGWLNPKIRGGGGRCPGTSPHPSSPPPPRRRHHDAAGRRGEQHHDGAAG